MNSETARYAITNISDDFVFHQGEIASAGGKDIVLRRRVGVCFASLTEEQADTLRGKGYSVIRVIAVHAQDVETPFPVAATPRYTLDQIAMGDKTDQLRAMVDPPLYGQGMNVAILDTGIRETHELIPCEFIMRKNYTSSPSTDDVYDHGTGVASAFASVAPKARLLNLKVLDDEGLGSSEQLVEAIEDCLDLHDSDIANAPYAINLSLGAPDSNDPNDPVRIACRRCIENNIWVIAAAGNSGPDPSTILSPASEEYVLAVGSCDFDTLEVSEFSSRGPTQGGIVKPDMLSFGQDLIIASSASDTATTAKSGTSFATPLVTGLCVLGHEFILTQAESRLGSIDAALEYLQSETPLPVRFTTLHPAICGKPEGVSSGKDDEYGWGVLLPDLAADALVAATSGLGIEKLFQMFMSMLLVCMLAKASKIYTQKATKCLYRVFVEHRDPLIAASERRHGVSECRYRYAYSPNQAARFVRRADPSCRVLRVEKGSPRGLELQADGS